MLHRSPSAIVAFILLSNAPSPAQVTATFKGHQHTITCLAFSRDGALLASGSKDGTVRLWDARTREPLAVLDGHRDMVVTVAFSPDGKLLASCSHDTAIKLWDTKSGKEQRALRGHAKDVRGLAFAPDGKTLASGGMDQIVQLWDTTSWEARRTLRGHTAEINCVAFSKDSKTLASGAWDKTVRLWDGATGEPLHVLKGHTEMVRDVVFTPDGQTLLSSGKDGMIRAWDLEGGSMRYLLDGHKGNLVRSLSLSPKGTRLASVSRDGTLNLWDLQAGQVTASLREGVLSFQVVAFSPAGDVLAVGGIDRNVNLLDVAKLAAGADKGKPLPGDKVLTPAEARKRVGESIVVEMEVRAAKNRLEKRKEIYLDAEENFRDEKNFAVVINVAGAARFKDMGIADPAEHFMGKTIRVRGSVTVVQDVPRILVADPGQITLR
jgi:WD40 repeat protein